MKSYLEISVTGFSRRRVIAQFPDRPFPKNHTPEDLRVYLEHDDKINAAIAADPDIVLGGAIEEALNIALGRAFKAGVRSADGFAAAAVADPAVRAAIERPGGAAVLLRQFVGMMVASEMERDEDYDDERQLARFLTDEQLLPALEKHDTRSLRLVDNGPPDPPATA